MPYLTIFLNNPQTDNLNKLCAKRKCTKYEIGKIALLKYIEEEIEKLDRGENPPTNPEDFRRDQRIEEIIGKEA
jgi:hypothetical protein